MIQKFFFDPECHSSTSCCPHASWQRWQGSFGSSDLCPSVLLQAIAAFITIRPQGSEDEDPEDEEQYRRLEERWRFDVPPIGPEGVEENDRVLVDDYDTMYVLFMLSTFGRFTPFTFRFLKHHIPFSIGKRAY
jgi:hypothetical protein